MIILLMICNYKIFAQTEINKISPEQIAFNHFKDSIISQNSDSTQYYFGGKVSAKSSTSPYPIGEIKMNFDTCFNQNSFPKEIIFIPNDKIRKSGFLKKPNLVINSACNISNELFLVNIVYSRKGKGTIYHFLISNNDVIKVKLVSFIH